MTSWFKENVSVVWSWAALIGIAVIVFAVGRVAGFQQFGIGLLIAALALLVAMAVFELIWQLLIKWFNPAGGKDTPSSPPKHRSRGQ